MAVFWEGPDGRPVIGHAVGAPLAGAVDAVAELEVAKAGGEGVVLVPLGGAGETPWGAVLVAGVGTEQGDRLSKLLPYFTGALWAARRFRQSQPAAIERVVPQHVAPPVEAPAGWPSPLQ